MVTPIPYGPKPMARMVIWGIGALWFWGVFGIHARGLQLGEANAASRGHDVLCRSSRGGLGWRIDEGVSVVEEGHLPMGPALQVDTRGTGWRRRGGEVEEGLGRKQKVTSRKQKVFGQR